MLATLLLATVTVAVPALQSRPPGLDLTGSRLAAWDAAVAQAQQAITDKRLTKDGRRGPAAQTLLERVLTAEPFHPAALAAMERLIQALMAHAQGKLAAATPDLEGARDYWTKARDLAVAWQVSGSTAALDELRLAIDSKELAAARQAEHAARKALQARQRALTAAEKAQADLAKRLAETEAARARLAEENARLQASQSSTRGPAKPDTGKTASQAGGRVTLRSQPRTLGDHEVDAMLKQRDFFSCGWSKRHCSGKGLANDFVNNGNGTVTDRATGLMWQQGGDFKAFDNLDEYVKQLNRKRFAGHDDWRLPTLEEAASLVEPQKNDDLYIAPIFDRRQVWIWTADVVEGEEEEADGALIQWVVYLDAGSVEPGGADGAVRACRISGK